MVPTANSKLAGKSISAFPILSDSIPKIQMVSQPFKKTGRVYTIADICLLASYYANYNANEH